MIVGVKNPVRSTVLNGSDVTIEWTYGAGGAIASIDRNDLALAGVAAPVVDSGSAGITNLVFPACDRVDILNVQLEPAAADVADATDYRMCVITGRNPSAGTAVLRLLQPEVTEAIADPTTGSKGSITLRLST